VPTLLLLLAAVAAEPSGGAIGRAADDLAARAAERLEPAKVALATLAPGEDGLREPTETAVASALSRRGHSVLPLRGSQLADPEGAARALGADLLLRVRASLAGGVVSLSGEVVPTRPNFFLQRAPAARGASVRLVAATAPADDVARALAAAARPAAGPMRLLPLADLPRRVLAMAAGITEEGLRLAAVTPEGVALLDPRGAQVAFRPLPPAPPGPRVRDAAAVVCIGDFAGGRIAYAVAGRPDGEILSAARGELAHAGSLSSAAAPAAVPIASGGAGALFGAFVPGRGVLADVLSASPVASAPPAGARELFGAAAAPRPGRAAYAVLATDYTLRVLGPNLAPVLPEIRAVGAGFALADLDGDGEPELVASSARPGPSDGARVLRLGAPPSVIFESSEVEGAFVAGAAADVTGDGLDDAILAAALPGGGTRLWILTADARAAWP
jgi:hypothetical protein